MKMKTFYLFALLFLLVVLGGCLGADSKMHYSSLEKAVSVNLSDISAKEAIRSNWEDDKLYILFYRENAMGIASVTKSKKGYQWVDELSFFTGHYATFSLVENKDMLVIGGKTENKNAKQVKVRGHDHEVLVDVHDGYYLVVNFPENEVVSIEPVY